MSCSKFPLRLVIDFHKFFLDRSAESHTQTRRKHPQTWWNACMLVYASYASVSSQISLNFFFKVNFYLMSISIWRRKSQYTEEECKKANNFKASVLMLQMANFSKTKVRQYVCCESYVFRSNYIYCAFFPFQFWDMFRPTWSLQIMLFKKEGEWGSVRWLEGWFSGGGWHRWWLRRRLQ